MRSSSDSVLSVRLDALAAPPSGAPDGPLAHVVARGVLSLSEPIALLLERVLPAHVQDVLLAVGVLHFGAVRTTRWTTLTATFASFRALTWGKWQKQFPVVLLRLRDVCWEEYHPYKSIL